MPYVPLIGYGADAPVTTTTPAPAKELPKWAPPLIVGGVIILAGLVIYTTIQKYQVMKTVAAKEGGSGVLKMEAGEAAIGLADAFGGAMMRRNRSRRRGRARRRR